jgi:hypothetical protein
MLEHADRTVAVLGIARQFDPDAATLTERLRLAGRVLFRGAAAALRHASRIVARTPHALPTLWSAAIRLSSWAARQAIALVRCAGRAVGCVALSARRMPHLLCATATALRLLTIVCGRSLLHAMVTLAGAVARTAVWIVQGLPRLARRSLSVAWALGRLAGRTATMVPHLVRLLCVTAIGVLSRIGKDAIAFIREVGRAAAGLPWIVALGITLLARSAVAGTRALLSFLSGAARYARGMPHLLRVTSTLLRLIVCAWGQSSMHTFVAFARGARRGIGVARNIPALVRRFALTASALVRQTCRALRPTPLRLYVGLPVLIALLAGLAAGSAEEAISTDNLARPTIVLLASALCAAALASLAGRAVALTAHTRRISPQSGGTPGRVVRLESQWGPRRVLSSGRVTVETISGRDRRLVAITLLGGQHAGVLESGVTVLLRGRLSPRGGIVALSAGDGIPLAGTAVLYGPVRVTSPEVVQRFRAMLHRRLRAPIAATVVALLVVALRLLMGGSALIAGIAALAAGAWLLLTALRLRGFWILLRRGCEVREAHVIGTVQEPWFAGWAKGGTLWLFAHGCKDASPLEVRLTGKRAVVARPGDAVSVYSGCGRRAPVLVVGAGPESSLIGWATPVTAARATTKDISTAAGARFLCPDRASSTVMSSRR